MTLREDSETPSNRWRWGCGCLGVLFLLVLTPLLIWQLERGRAARKVAKEIARLRAAGQPVTTVEVNAAYKPAEGRPDMTQEIIAALALCEQKEIAEAGQTFPIVGNKHDKSPIPSPGEPWDDRPAIEAWLAQLAEAIATFHQVQQNGGTARYPTDYRPGFGALLPSVQSLRAGARVLALSSQVHLHAGEIEQAIEDTLAILALARTLENEPCYISQLVRVALTSIALGQLKQILEHTETSDADLVRFQAALRQIDTASTLRRAMQGERACCLLACQTFSISGTDVANIDGDEAERLMGQNIRRPHDAEVILGYFRRLLEANDKSPVALLAESKSVEAELKASMASPMQRLQTPVASLTLPANVAAVEAVLRGDALCRTADAAIACERFRRQHENWPKEIEELVPAFLPVVPLDPFSGKPLLIQRDEQGCLIYSIGRNQLDNGGNIEEPQLLDNGFRVGTIKAE